MTNTKLDDAITYELFKDLPADPNTSQRALSRTLDISLGKVNYCLQALIAKGLVKARITARFLLHKIAEYEKLQLEIETMRREVEKYQYSQEKETIECH